MSAVEPVGPALAVSALLHAAALLVAFGILAHRPAPKLTVDAGASWAGDTFDVDELVAAEKRASAPAGVEPAGGAARTTETSAEGDKVFVKKAKRARPREPRSAPESSAALASSATPGSASATPPTTSGSEPTGGQTGSAPAAPAKLAKAFTRAVTAATHRDSLWDELPVGRVGAVTVVVSVDAEGKISASKLKDEKTVPAALERLVERTLKLLAAGRFALDARESGAGTETLAIVVELSAGEPSEGYDDPRHTVSLGFEPPSGAMAGRAYFVHASGRRFEAKISIVE
jgi:hypothetical protein